MKSFLFASILAFIISGFSTEAIAQGRRHKHKAKAENQESSVFIDNIEVSPGKGGGPLVNYPVPNKISDQVPVNTGYHSAETRYQSYQFKYGQLLNREVELISNAPLFMFIDAWWATPYRYGGTTHKGIDCSAFSSTLYAKVFGIQIPRTARDQYSYCEKLNDDEIQEGDLLFFNTRGGVSHVGVSLGGKYFVHASTSSGVMISSLDEDYYNRRYLGAGRVESAQFAQKNTTR